MWYVGKSALDVACTKSLPWMWYEGKFALGGVDVVCRKVCLELGVGMGFLEF